MTTVGPAARKLQKNMAAETRIAIYQRYLLDQFRGSEVDG
jgi:hypothetical protein